MSNVIAKDLGQFASQMLGRLLPHQNIPAIAECSKRTGDTTHAPCLRSMLGTLHPPGTGLLRTLTGHSAWVHAAVITSVGQPVISTCLDNTAKAWELETGEVFATFTCGSAATCCAFSEALELIVAGDVDGHVHFQHLEEPRRKA